GLDDLGAAHRAAILVLGAARGLAGVTGVELYGLGGAAGEADDELDVVAAALEGVVGDVGGDVDVVAVVGDGAPGLEVGLSDLAPEGVREALEAVPFLWDSVELDRFRLDEICLEGDAVGHGRGGKGGGSEGGGAGEEGAARHR